MCLAQQTEKNKTDQFIQLGLAQSLDQLCCLEDVTDSSEEILFLSFLREVIVTSCGMGMAVHSLMLSIQHFLCQPWCPDPPRCPEGWFWRGCHGGWHAQTMMVLERLSWWVTCPNYDGSGEAVIVGDMPKLWWFWRGCHGGWHAQTMQVLVLRVTRRGSLGPTRKLIMPRTQSLILSSRYEMQSSFLGHLALKAWILFS